MIRDAIAQDAEAIAAFWRPWIETTPITFNSIAKSPQEIAEMIEARHAAGHGFKVGLSPAGEVLGFASYGQFRGGPGYARTMEHTIILAPEARGTGLGRSLMAAIEAHAKAQGYHAMVACVSGENPAGRDFHAALGYALWGTLPQVGRKFDRYMDLWIMGKLL